MIKGCNKRVIVMKETGNEMIEEAFFILRPGFEKAYVSQSDILCQANTILSSGDCVDRFSSICMNYKKPLRDYKSAKLFLLGFFLGLALMGALWLVTVT